MKRSDGGNPSVLSELAGELVDFFCGSLGLGNHTSVVYVPQVTPWTRRDMFKE